MYFPDLLHTTTTTKTYPIDWKRFIICFLCHDNISYSNGDFHVPFSISVSHSLLHMLHESFVFSFCCCCIFIIYSTSSFYFISFHKALSYFHTNTILEKHIFFFYVKIPSPTPILSYKNNTYTYYHHYIRSFFYFFFCSHTFILQATSNFPSIFTLAIMFCCCY